MDTALVVVRLAIDYIAAVDGDPDLNTRASAVLLLHAVVLRAADVLPHVCQYVTLSVEEDVSEWYAVVRLGGDSRGEIAEEEG